MKNRIAAVAALGAIMMLSAPAWAATANAPGPAFTLTSRDGKQVSLKQFKGDVVMINFWASWCGPCRQEMPLLDGIYKQYKSLGFVLLGVNVEPDSKAANAWLKKTPVSYPILYDTHSTVSRLYRVQGMPTTVILGRKGNIRFVHQGYVPGDENGYLNSIRALLMEQ
jgi:thiol-disulfide isomerase/thioredoxin